MNLIGKEAHVSYDYGGSIATVSGTITSIAPLQNSFNAGNVDDPMMIEVTDGDEVRYIPAKNIVHIHVGKLE